jgi:hypothetical protein
MMNTLEQSGNRRCSRVFSSFSIAHASKTQLKRSAQRATVSRRVLHFNIESGFRI